MLKIQNLNNLLKTTNYAQCNRLCSRYLCSDTSTSKDKLSNFHKQITENSSSFTKFQIFRDEQEIIFDVEEERRKLNGPFETVAELHRSVYDNLNLERGRSGVFEIGELVEVLKKDNGVDIFVCEVSKELKYVDYMCIVTGNSFRHMLGMASFVRKVYKLKRHQTDRIPKIEGDNCKNWMAMDLGNIALHIFSKSARERYDLETLWSLGPEYDNKSNQRDLLNELFEQHTIPLVKENTKQQP